MKNFKRRAFIRYKGVFLVLAIIIAVLTSGCSAPQYPIEVKNCLSGISDTFKKSIDGTDFYDTLLPFIDIEKPELSIETARRLKDIKQMGVSEIKFEIVDMKKGVEGLEKDDLRIKIRETYKKNNTTELLNYWADFKIKAGKAYYSDLAFKQMEEGNITLYYDQSLSPISNKIFASIKASHEKVGDLLPGRTDKIIVKAYSDRQIFSSFIKPSIGFDMMGWNEAGEAIKINFGLINWEGMGDPVLKKLLDSILIHESTHLISGVMSGNNMPYWFAEGLATYAENAPLSGAPSVTLDDLATENIENITDGKLIKQFYLDSGIYIKAFVEKKGKDELVRLIKLMGEYPKNKEDAGSSMDASNKIFEEIITKEYGLGTRKLGEMLVK